MVVRLIFVAFGFDLGRAAATFFDLIIVGGFEDPVVMPSDGMPSSTKAGCAGSSLLAAVISSRSPFADASGESEMPTVVSATGWATATALRGGVRSSIVSPTPNAMRTLKNTILSMMPLRLNWCGQNSPIQ
jgi:hypothetical protein